MSNPTGSTYLQANQNYLWQDGDVYQIPQGDTVEGAAASASFSGLGVANQPHQFLLNKIQQLHNKQLADEATISALFAFLNLFTSTVGPIVEAPGPDLYATDRGGWMKLQSQDVTLGSIQVLYQWGWIDLSPYGEPLSISAGEYPLPTTFPFDFPIPFPHAVWMLVPYWQTNDTNNAFNVTGTLGGGSTEANYTLSVATPFGLSRNTIVYGLSAAGTLQDAMIASPLPGQAGNPGLTNLGWAAVGY